MVRVARLGSLRVQALASARAVAKLPASPVTGRLESTQSQLCVRAWEQQGTSWAGLAQGAKGPGVAAMRAVWLPATACTVGSPASRTAPGGRGGFLVGPGKVQPLGNPGHRALVGWPAAAALGAQCNCCSVPRKHRPGASCQRPFPGMPANWSSHNCASPSLGKLQLRQDKLRLVQRISEPTHGVSPHTFLNLSAELPTGSLSRWLQIRGGALCQGDARPPGEARSRGPGPRRRVELL